MSADFSVFFDVAWVRFVLGLIVGSILGSFATMLVHRLPRRLSIVFPRSHCPLCNTTLGARDLVPIFSWLAMRGRCRHCKAKIGTRYLIVEITASLACAVASVVVGFTSLLLVTYAVVVAVIVFFCIKRTL